MPTPTIDTIRNLKNVGVFADVTTGQFPHRFKRFNLVYGFNGCGKTTLSRLLDSLGVDGLNENLSENSDFSFTLSDGSHPSTSDLRSAVSRYIAVFNEDYVERTLTWKEGAAKPIIYLGKEQADLAKKLSELETEESPAIQNDVLHSAEWSAASRALETRCRDTARLVAEELNVGRRYNAANLKADYDALTLSLDDKLSDEERKSLKEIINRSEIPNKSARASISFSLGDLPNVVSTVLRVEVAEIAIAALERRKDALSWIEDGLLLHKNEQECLFCGNILMGRRIAELQAALAGGFESLARQLDAAQERIASFVQNCRNNLSEFSDPIETLPTFRTAVENRRKAVIAVLSDGELIASQWLEQLGEKRARPDQQADAAMIAESWDEQFREAVSLLNIEVDNNNSSIENFSNEQESAQNKLKRHYLVDHKSLYFEAVLYERDSKKTLDESREKLQKIRAAISETRAQLRTHGPAARELNKHLKSYLGHDHISLESVDDGYRICRDRKESQKPLSEGEKTAVAFCYFLTSLAAEGREIKDTIVVLDDPISSLDARAMTHVVSVIRITFKNPAQIFIMTHNLDFMRELKKWLFNKYKKEEADFLFIETGILADGTRTSSITKMPRLIRDYESEYHYLYSLVKSLAENPDGFERFAYLMPNAIRKVLDIFLAFKEPGSSGLEPKVDKIILDYSGLDAGRIKAMERLSQLESHSENIGDVITFSAYTLVQVSDAAKCLLELIEHVDDKHKAAMDRLCRP